MKTNVKFVTRIEIPNDIVREAAKVVVGVVSGVPSAFIEEHGKSYHGEWIIMLNPDEIKRLSQLCADIITRIERESAT